MAGSGWFSVINSGWFGLLVGSAVGIISILIGYAQYRRSKQISRLNYLTFEFEVVGSPATAQAKDLEIRFRGRPVPRLMKFGVGIWNSGTTTIEGQSVVAVDPLKLTLADTTAEILRADVVASSRFANQVEVELLPTLRDVVVKFGYLDPGDGLRIELLHTASRGEIDLRGSIKGLPNGLELKGPHPAFGVLGKVLLAITAILCAAMLLGVVWLLAYTAWTGNLKTTALVAAPIVGSVFVAFLGYRSGGKPSEPMRVSDIPDVITDDQAFLGMPALHDRGG